MSQSVEVAYSIDNRAQYAKLYGALSEFLSMILEAKQGFSQDDDEIEFQLNKIGETAVRDWYNDYSPRFYRRTEDLFNAYKVTVDHQEHTRDFEVGSEFMEYAHHQDNDLIYQIAFVNGIHGGFPKQNFAGRVPVGIFSEFSSNSQPQSASPRDAIQPQVQQLLKDYDDKELKVVEKLYEKFTSIKQMA